MSNTSRRDSKLLNELIKDCITFKLSEVEALEYIKQRFGKSIAGITYKHRKARVLSDQSTNIWLNNFTRIGYVNNHKRDIETIQKLRDDSLRQFLIETLKPNRDEYKILKLKHDIRENTQLLSELNLGTPIISAIKAKLEQKDRQNDSNSKTLQISK